jgi:outer membrane protein OmpA-like peptidoglycan-associated protein
MGGLGWTPLAPAACIEGQPYALADCGELDQDHDGVRNALDACPEQPGPVSGCPDGDDDADGVQNLADRCPNEVGSARHGGCPVADTDHDGVNDELDACPDEAGPNNGCADLDSDHDGVADRLDACPTVAGVDTTGCGEAPAPAPAPASLQPPVAVVAGTQLQLAEKISFTVGRAEIAAASYRLLDQVALVLREHPELNHIRIEGHTDDSGVRALNVALSQQRAEAVKTYLSHHGVDAARLEAKGFGPTHPIANNLTAAGRERNRRVEFFTAP